MAKTSNRRRFLKESLAAAAAAIAIPGYAARSATARGYSSPTGRCSIALIGAGERGLFLARTCEQFGDVVAIADADHCRAEKARESLNKHAIVTQDYRRLLDRSDVEVVINATPDHWHTAINVNACRAGKDVYAEKPLTLTIDEGKTLCRVVEETSRVVQVGANQRSGPQFQLVAKMVREGAIGKLRRVAVLLPFWSTKGGPYEGRTVPAELDWDRYQGQAPVRPYHPERTHFSFRWWWEYAGGIICDWGNHHLDIAHWGMDVEKSGPLWVEGRANFPNAGKPLHFNNPDRFAVRMLYPGDVRVDFLVVRDDKYLASMQQGEISAEEDATLFEEVPEDLQHEQRNGIMFIGEKGRLFVNRGGAYGRAVEELDEIDLLRASWGLESTSPHVENFFHCVETRETPAAPVSVEHRTMTACHLGNIAMRLGRRIVWDAVNEQIVGDKEAESWQRREQRSPYHIPA